MPAATESIGSLVIDLRANVAQLQADMDQVKTVVTKSSAQLSSQMRSDMQETRQVLMLMRDDFGVGIPRELAKVIASSELARAAILGMSNAFIGLAFINLGVEAFNKIQGYLEKSSKQAEEEAKQTQTAVFAAQDLLQATSQRAEQLALIGKGEDERHAIQQKYFQEELAHNKLMLAGLRDQLAAKLALVNEKLSLNPGTINTVTGDSVDTGDDPDARNAALQKYNKDNADLIKRVQDLQKAVSDATTGLMDDDQQYSDYVQSLGLQRIQEEERLADAEIELKKRTAQTLFDTQQISLDQEFLMLRSAETERHNAHVQALNEEINLLNENQDKNKAAIEKAHNELKLEDLKYYADLSQYSSDYYTKKEAQRQADLKAEQDMLRSLSEMQKQQAPGLQAAAGALAGSFASNATPALSPNIMGAAVDRFAAGFKDAAAQGKLLEQAMDDMLTPMDKFKIEQQEIELLKEKFADYPDVVKALDRELQKANPDFAAMKQISQEFANDLANEMNSAIMGTESWHQALTNILKDVAELILKYTVLTPLVKALSGDNGGGSSAGFFGSLLGSIFGHHAYGGRPSTNQVSMVGENGPELFVPDTAGTIIPNGDFGGNGTSIYIDARGADASVEQKIMRAIAKLAQQTPAIAVQAVQSYQSRR